MTATMFSHLSAAMPVPNQPDSFDALRRAGLFLFLVIAGWILLPSVLRVDDAILRSTLATFGAGLIANTATVHLFEHGWVSDFGLGWGNSSIKQLGAGLALGLGSVGGLTLAAIGLGLATIERVEGNSDWPFPVLLILLAAGAAGEELMFHGYGFQILTRLWSAWGTIAATGALFGIAHLLTNEGINPVGTINTALWGALLGYACWRTQGLWLPMGLHFGWNIGLVLIGVPLSGLTIKATGFALRWSASELFSGGMYGPENGLLTTVCGGAVYVFLRGGKRGR